MDKFLEKANFGMDSILKVCSFAFTFCVVIGAALIWHYFKGVGLGGEVVGLLGSPVILFSIALYGVLIALYILMLVVSAPLTIQYCLSDEFNWKSPPTAFNPLAVGFGVAVPLVLFLVSAWLDIGSSPVMIVFSLVIFVYTLLIYRQCGGAKSNKKSENLEVLLQLMFILSVCGVLLVFLMLPFSKAVANLGISLGWQILIIAVLIAVYSFCVALANDTKKISNYSPLALLSIILMALLFDDVSKNIVKNIGLGGFETNITVLNDHITELPREISVRPAKNSTKVSALESVWVVAALPDKMVLAAHDNKEVRYTIPSKAILSEW